MGEVRRKNHTVTRGYIANWKSKKGDQTGIWYYDIRDKKIKFSMGQQASFAITKDIYAPVNAKGVRDDRLEKWFSRSESQMCDFAKTFGTSPQRKWKFNAVKKALESIVSMGNRGDFAIANIDAFYREQYPAESDDQIRIRTLDNVYSTTLQKTEFFRQGTAVIVTSEDQIFMTNDQPFWDMSPRTGDEPFAIFTLSPNRALVLVPFANWKPGQMRFEIRPLGQMPSVERFARLAAMRMARRWVVCPNQEAAQMVASYLTDEVIAEAWATDRLIAIEKTNSDMLFEEISSF